MTIRISSRLKQAVKATPPLRVLEHAERHGDVSQTCRYFGIGRASFYRWKSAFERYGEAGLANP
ncbi:helix-turn-helix domain-containing protein [Agrobacterium pusense]|uniref:Helix-turn-helix domain-containing protein n=1 Tax=Agrobacterium pusense TaxID=648995 RepID=A0A6H0ZTK2_9HYPH|nr:helix-turn-helix domain-containing protein [Agrobacterium pusense]